MKLNASDEEIRYWNTVWPWADNTGANARRTPGLDIDILDEAAAEAVEELARKHFEEHGDILVRSGRAPKRLIPLRTDEPFKKLRRDFIAPNGMKHAIEILGDGQQWVCYGIHPGTGQPYSWHGGELATTKREALPYVRLEDAQRFIDDAVKLLAEEFQYVLASASADNGKAHEPGEPQASIERIAAALNVIPNNEDWDGWNSVGMATWRASGGAAESDPVLHVACEGLAGLPKRANAAAKRRGWDEKTFPENYFTATGKPTLIESTDHGRTFMPHPDDILVAIEDVKAQAGRLPIAVAIDTAFRSFGAGNVNASDHMNAYLRAIDVILAMGMAAAAVHHEIKSGGTPAGSVSLIGGSDTILVTKRGDARREHFWQIEMAKDDAETGWRMFHLDPITLGINVAPH